MSDTKLIPDIQPNLDTITALDLMAMLKQPGCLHMNILRGLFPLTRAEALHIAGATDYDALRAEVARLRTTLAKYADRENWDELGIYQRWIGDGDGWEPAEAALANETPTV